MGSILQLCRMGLMYVTNRPKLVLSILGNVSLLVLLSWSLCPQELELMNSKRNRYFLYCLR